MTEGHAVARWMVLSALVLTATGLEPAGAAQIRMKDGAEISGTVVEKDGESLFIRVDRSAIESVDGVAVPAPITVGTTAPTFTAVDRKGVTHSLAENRGHVTLLKFWASWCPFCRSDIPMMKQLFAKYQNKAFRIVTVSVDQDPGQLEALIAEEGLTYPIIMGQAHPTLSGLYETQGIPAYFLIDQEGKIVQVWRGSVTQSNVDVEGIVEDLLKSPST